jgi:DNA-binding ferritin-like protein (Dps family)
MKSLINKKKFDITKTFKVNLDEVQRIIRLREITRLNQSVLLDTALEILETQLKNGKSLNELLTLKKLTIKKTL